jgi:hypothetical protein
MAWATIWAIFSQTHLVIMATRHPLTKIGSILFVLGGIVGCRTTRNSFFRVNSPLSD